MTSSELDGSFRIIEGEKWQGERQDTQIQMKVKSMMGNEKTETFYLSWLDAKRGTRKPAGVAFFDSEFGDYRLKLDFFPETQYYLRSMGGDGITNRYRLEVVHKNKEGKFQRRVPVGEGCLLASGEIRIEPFPFEKELILILKDTK